MAKDPAFLWYPGDWLGGTIRFTRLQKGAYIDLLMAQFNGGHMTGQDIAQVLGQDYPLVWDDNLKSKFKIDADGKYYNVRLENEQIKRKKFVDSRHNNLEGVNQYGHKEGQVTSLMENENINVNVNEYINVVKDVIKQSKKKIEIPEFNEFMTYAMNIEIYCHEFDFQIKAKYEAWKENGWKDGNNSVIKNWKTKLKNTMPYFKKNGGNNGTNKRSASFVSNEEFKQDVKDLYEGREETNFHQG
ncbi:MAG TPA: hypothetical protein VMV36_08530 [Ignavibacteriaceae bacterium]|nr:hypothetical protein [Ignavibacteriaceae bacterium]